MIGSHESTKAATAEPLGAGRGRRRPRPPPSPRRRRWRRDAESLQLLLSHPPVRACLNLGVWGQVDMFPQRLSQVTGPEPGPEPEVA